MAFRREVLEELDGFDENLGYGEDFDLDHRVHNSNYKERNTNIVIYQHLVSSLPAVFHQGQWYGKSMFDFFRKYPKTAYSLLSVFFFSLWPINAVFSLISNFILYLLLLQTSMILFYVIDGYIQTKNPYMIFVPLIKTIRSWGEIMGMIEGVFTNDYGKK